MRNPSESPFSPPNPLLSVVVPAYNEESRIGATLERMLEYLDGDGRPYEVLIVDDGSTDATIERVRVIAEGRANVHLLHYDGNRGKGHAVRYGVLRASGDFILFSDADLATPIEEVANLLGHVRAGAEVAIGSRDIPGARLERRQAWWREMGGKLFNRVVQVVAVPGIRDTQCGFKLFTRAAAQNTFRLCRIDNFSFDVEVLYVARRLGYRVAEVPVRWAHQEGSKVVFVRDALRMLRTLFRIRATAYELSRAETERTTVP